MPTNFKIKESAWTTKVVFTCSWSTYRRRSFGPVFKLTPWYSVTVLYTRRLFCRFLAQGWRRLPNQRRTLPTVVLVSWWNVTQYVSHSTTRRRLRYGQKPQRCRRLAQSPLIRLVGQRAVQQALYSNSTANCTTRVYIKSKPYNKSASWCCIVCCIQRIHKKRSSGDCAFTSNTHYFFLLF